MLKEKLIKFPNPRESNIIRGNTVRIGVFEAPIWAGTPTDVPEMPPEFSEYIDVPEEYVKNSDKTFIYKVSGDSMEPKLYDGDKVVVDCSQIALNYGTIDKIIVAFLDGGLVVKKLQVINNHLYLVSENPYYRPYQLDRPGVYFKPYGIVLGVIEFRRI